jgi:hypothetical protein
MSRATPKMRAFAARLIAREAKGNQSPGPTPGAVFPVLEKLQPHLATLMGNTGFRALLARSLLLAGAEFPWLRTLKVRADGTLEKPDEGATPADPEKIFEGRVVLLAHLLGLLVAFIGENLTLRLVDEIWAPSEKNDLNFDKGTK